MRFDNRDRLYVKADLESGAISKDAFERIRVSEPLSQFDSQFQYDLQSFVWEPITSGGGTVTHVPAVAAARLAVPAVLSSFAVLQTYQYFRYFPGRSHEILMTFCFGTPTAGILKRVGYFDLADGIALEQNGNVDVAFNLRSSAPVLTNTRVPQSDWNIDRFDGSGPSGVTLDFSKGQILWVQAQWLGLGRLEVGFDVNGRIYPAHQFFAANSIAVPYTRTFNLPLRYEMTNLTGANTGSFDGFCATVINCGQVGYESSYQFGGASVPAITVTTGAEIPLYSLRPAATFNGITNRVLIIPEMATVLTGTNPIRVRILYNAAVTGGAWVGGGGTACEVNSTATAVSGGTAVQAFYAAASNQVQSSPAMPLAFRYPITLDNAGANPRNIVVAAIALGGNSDCRAGLNWRELR